jgi:hypothetical protein
MALDSGRSLAFADAAVLGAAPAGSAAATMVALVGIASGRVASVRLILDNFRCSTGCTM